MRHEPRLRNIPDAFKPPIPDASIGTVLGVGGCDRVDPDTPSIQPANICAFPLEDEIEILVITLGLRLAKIWHEQFTNFREQIGRSTQFGVAKLI